MVADTTLSPGTSEQGSRLFQPLLRRSDDLSPMLRCCLLIPQLPRAFAVLGPDFGVPTEAFYFPAKGAQQEREGAVLCSALSDQAYGPVSLCFCYAMPGNDIAYGAAGRPPLAAYSCAVRGTAVRSEVPRVVLRALNQRASLLSTQLPVSRRRYVPTRSLRARYAQPGTGSMVLRASVGSSTGLRVGSA
eukprot:1535561-Rhodomonas_salina.4